MNESDKTRLEEIREREKKATKGPWELNMLAIHPSHPPPHNPHASVCLDEPEREDWEKTRVAHCHCTVGKYEIEERNATFIAHSREDIPFLLDLIESLEASRDALADALREGMTECPNCVEGKGYWDHNEREFRACGPYPECKITGRKP